jgi:hypothetical protein
MKKFSLTKLKTFLKSNNTVQKIIKHKLLFSISLVTLSLLLIIIILLFVSPAIKVDSLPKPTVNVVKSLTNESTQNFAISDDKGIYIEHGSQRFFSTNNNVDVTNIAEGIQEFRVHSMSEFYLFKLISTESELIKIEFDYTSVEVVEVKNIKEEYYAINNSISFQTQELPITIDINFDNNSYQAKFTTIPKEINVATQPDNMTDEDVAPCTQTKIDMETEALEYTCVLTLPEERQYPISFSINDEANNKYYLFENVEIAYVTPVSLVCNEMTSITNQKEFTKTCTVSKDGFVFVDSEKVEVKKDQPIEYKFSLQNEGENTIIVKTGDESGREFIEESKILLDTIAPEFTSVTVSDTYGNCDPDGYFEDYNQFHVCQKRNSAKSIINISFASNENVKVTLATRPKLFPGTTGRGATNNTFELEAGKNYSTTVNGNNYWGGYPNSGGINFDVIVDITIWDQAGNKTFFTKTVKKVVVK